MLFLNDDLTFSMSTKFFEYIALKKKIIVFSHWGELAEYVTQNKIGYSVTPENFKISFLKILNELRKEGTVFNPSFDTKQFSLNILTDKLTRLFLKK